MNDEERPISGEFPEEIEIGDVAEQTRVTNDYFRKMIDRNFLDYASYVIGSRAIPDVDDGLKPVQRRILWALYQVYDGRTQKVANIVGNTMHYHPHGDASIGDALVVLANKGGCVEEIYTDRKTGKQQSTFVSVPYFINKQGNFGNILTGSPAAAGRYTECGLTKLAYETMFNNDITPFIPNYDGRDKEPVVLPAKVPSLLMLGSDGIAVGMSTTILPHNFNELTDAEIAVLSGKPFQLYPDFQQGGLMDVREYDDGNGKIVLRAKIDIDGRDLVIREIPATCTTEMLVNSIERAAEKNKIRISSVDDFTTDRVEIRVTPTRGYTPEKTLQGLYMYTDCSVSISPRMVVICDRKPVQMTVSQVLRRNVEKLVSYLKRELEIELERQSELRHAKTLAQLFFEHRIYKKIEECKSQEEEYDEVLSGLAPFRSMLLRDVTREDVDKLLALPVRRIARFDIEKNQQELREIAEAIKKIRHHLTHLIDYAISQLSAIKEKYGKGFPRRTEIEQIEQIDRKAAALSNIKIGWDRRAGYIGRAVKSEDTLMCSDFDRLLCVEKSGKYRVIPLPPDKLFVGKLYALRKFDAATQFGVIYSETKSGKTYVKRTCISSFILEKEYMLCPKGCRLELLSPATDRIYRCLEIDGRGKSFEREINLMEFPIRAPKARGLLLTTKHLEDVTYVRDLTPEELAAVTPTPILNEDEPEEPEMPEEEIEEPVETAADVNVPIPPEILAIVAEAKESAKRCMVPESEPAATPVKRAPEPPTSLPEPKEEEPEVPVPAPETEAKQEKPPKKSPRKKKVSEEPAQDAVAPAPDKDLPFEQPEPEEKAESLPEPEPAPEVKSAQKPASEQKPEPQPDKKPVAEKKPEHKPPHAEQPAPVPRKRGSSDEEESPLQQEFLF